VTAENLPAGPAGAEGRHGSPPAVRLLLSVVLAVAVFWFLATKVDVGAAWTAVRDMTALELLTVVAVTAWNLLTYWALWVAATPGLSWGRAATLAQSGTALTNTLPGGSALGVRQAYGMLASWGFSAQRSSQAVLVTGMWNLAVKLGLPVVALGLLALQADLGGSRIPTGLASVLVLAAAAAAAVLAFRSDRTAAVLREAAARVAAPAVRLIRRPRPTGWGEATVDFRRRTVDLLGRRWLPVTAAAVISHLSLYLVLLVTLRHVGVTDAAVGWAEVLCVFATTRLLTAVRLTPGGAGVVEALLIGGLAAAGGVAAQVTAAVVVFRALTWLLPVPLGALTWLGWRLRGHRAPVATAEPAQAG